MDKPELYKFYGRKDISKWFGISEKTFSNNRQRYLDILGEYYEYRIEKRKYILLKEKKPFPETGLPKSKKTSRFEIQQEYREPVARALYRDPYQTYYTLAKKMEDEDYPIIKKYPQSIETRTKYIRGIAKADVDVDKMGGKWMRLDENYHLIDLTEEQQQFIDEYSDKNLSKIILDICGYIDSEIISPEEGAKMMLRSGLIVYQQMLKDFNKKFGFMPKKIPKMAEGIDFENPPQEYVIPIGWTGSTDPKELEQQYPLAKKGKGNWE